MNSSSTPHGIAKTKLVSRLRYWYPIFFGIPILLMAILKPWDSTVTIILSTFLSIVAMILTTFEITKVINQHRLKRVEDVIDEIKDKEKEERKLVRSFYAPINPTVTEFGAGSMRVRWDLNLAGKRVQLIFLKWDQGVVNCF